MLYFNFFRYGRCTRIYVVCRRFELGFLVEISFSPIQRIFSKYTRFDTISNPIGQITKIERPYYF